jgi:hypothetical protein
MAALLTSQVVALTTLQAQSLAVAQVFALTTAQLVAMETRDFAALSTNAIAALQTAQVTALTTRLINAITATQVPALTTSEMFAFSTAQMFALSTAVMSALTTAQAPALFASSMGGYNVSTPDAWFTAMTTAAKASYQTSTHTPIVLDLSGDGISTLSLQDGVKFDLTADGTPMQTGWVAPTDGLLVRDINADGAINDGRELFGDATRLSDGSVAKDGYQALSELDSNHDGVISSSDAAYGQLGVWVDANSDGISEAGEVKSLASLGITEISVSAQVTSALDHGNTIGLTSTYQTADGANHLAGDVWFATQDTATNGAALSTSVVVSLGTDQLSALNTIQVQALTTVYPQALQTQAIAALAAADGLAPIAAGSVTVSSPYTAQALTNDKSVPNTTPDGIPQAADGLAQRASALAQAIGTFDLTEALSSVATPSLNLPVDAYGGTKPSPTLAIGALVDQMRSFDLQNAAPTVNQVSTSTGAPAALTLMQVGPLGTLDPFKNSAPTDLGGLMLNNIQKR